MAEVAREIAAALGPHSRVEAARPAAGDPGRRRSGTVRIQSTTWQETPAAARDFALGHRAREYHASAMAVGGPCAGYLTCLSMSSSDRARNKAVFDDVLTGARLGG
ncbi:hypothetical protein ACFV1W_16295 [Kitasatospora sp. NPDC059648]|uniref:hypothetical protein n=1 Tax=Kitasatospora sp. NPDC059648 TaxID=3346894 RepID=UPI003674430A